MQIYFGNFYFGEYKLHSSNRPTSSNLKPLTNIKTRTGCLVMSQYRFQR